MNPAIYLTSLTGVSCRHLLEFLTEDGSQRDSSLVRLPLDTDLVKREETKVGRKDLLSQQREHQSSTGRCVSYPLFSRDVEKAAISDTTLWTALSDDTNKQCLPMKICMETSWCRVTTSYNGEVKFSTSKCKVERNDPNIMYSVTDSEFTITTKE